jgi:hypothetical protein
MSEKPASICKRWDSSVVKSTDTPFSLWASSCDVVIWTAIPHVEQIRWVRRQNKRTVVFVMWHEIATAADMHALAAADVVLCPSWACYNCLRNSGLGNVIHIGWDCGQPFHTKPAGYEITDPAILVPLWDGNARRCELTTANLIDLLLVRHKGLQVTVVCNSSTLSPVAARKFNRNRRIKMIKAVPPSRRFALFQSHDLTLYPSQFANTGMTAIQSIELGTPVAGFSYTPMNEILTSTNSLSIPCKEACNDVGFPQAIPDYDAMEEGLYYLLKDLEYLRQLQGTTLLGLSQRREAFTKAVLRVVV